MRRITTRGFGLFALLLATTATASPEAASVGQPASAVSQSHAPRIAVPGPGGSSATTPCNEPWKSSNWSGYAVNCATFTSVTGSWTVPSVSNPLGKKVAQYSSSWVGIDGFDRGDDNLIQAGTEQDWIDGTASYDAWWEILPAPETLIPSITVRPGDVMTVSITQGSPDWTITIADTTTHKSFTTERSYAGPQSSAEWIQEAPTVGGRIASLARDSPIVFEDLTANDAPPGLTSSEAGKMVKHRKVISIPSGPNAAGDGFTVVFGKTAPAPPPS